MMNIIIHILISFFYLIPTASISAPIYKYPYSQLLYLKTGGTEDVMIFIDGEKKRVKVDQLKVGVCFLEKAKDYSKSREALTLKYLDETYSANTIVQFYNAGPCKISNNMLNENVLQINMNDDEGSSVRFDNRLVTVKSKCKWRPRSFWQRLHPNVYAPMRSSTCLKSYVGHEIGHALGLAHEFSKRSRTSLCTWYLEAEGITDNYKTIDTLGNYRYDFNSIMNYHEQCMNNALGRDTNGRQVYRFANSEPNDNDYLGVNTYAYRYQDGRLNAARTLTLPTIYNYQTAASGYHELKDDHDIYKIMNTDNSMMDKEGYKYFDIILQGGNSVDFELINKDRVVVIHEKAGGTVGQKTLTRVGLKEGMKIRVTQTKQQTNTKNNWYDVIITRRFGK